MYNINNCISVLSITKVIILVMFVLNTNLFHSQTTFTESSQLFGLDIGGKSKSANSKKEHFHLLELINNSGTSVTVDLIAKYSKCPQIDKNMLLKNSTK